MTAANIRVLLCHDHEVLRSGLASLLAAAEGFEVVATAAGRGGGRGHDAAASRGTSC